ncbi:hypothetical protein COCSUDRAFT_57261 [Coccomyxa subellipsoidea C-169]|uniref:Galactose oxidase n=1 Tax=Coccomyxa subellipsoidea (strain C-169) TaxID=574566 RepID=I0YQM3_COCSC|nr:hypothetical protein COCSUDRAFT_57261 [Coccomyxa subellipsoidea C-169]EIE20692.1 hypothetical protein COCSUDRAFT_57261 [Coccomyxa subellipsoidea C-169]|eukprot:XP_005645236.1 hypothetical protein COCSUDRAFT_57261 [Coccomyxa subellipsoidea C-169]
MVALDMYSKQMQKGVYSMGAIVGDCLYLLTEPATSPDIMLRMRLRRENGTSNPVKEVFTTCRPKDCMYSSLVTDGEKLYIFGGCTLKNGATSAHNLLYTLKPGPTSSREKPLRWTDGQLHVFGGIEPWSPGDSTRDFRTLAGGAEYPLRTLGDLWRYDLKACCWKELEPTGTLPAARAHMGVAVEGNFTFISGGVTGFELARTKSNLADVWLYNAPECSWVQMAPSGNQSTWMSARHSHATAGVGSGILCLVGGCTSVSDRFSPARGLCFKLKTFHAQTAVVPRGRRKDGAMEGACQVLVLYREQSGLPPPVRELLAATKTGGCILYSQDPNMLSASVLTLATVADMPPYFRGFLFPYGLRYGSGRGKTSLQIGGSANDPFHPTPRHLAAPCEIQVHLVAPPVPQQPSHEGATSISSTVKLFGTVKAAVAYWRSVLPVKSSSGPGWTIVDEYSWHRFASEVEIIRENDGSRPERPKRAERFTEFAYFVRRNPDKGFGAVLAGNFAAAKQHLEMPLLPVRQSKEQVAEYRWNATAVSATLQAFLSTQDSVALPKLLKQYKASPKYQYQASMLTMAPPEIGLEGTYEDMFSCGHFMDMQILVMRLMNKDLFTYCIFVQRGDIIIFVDSFSKVPVRLVKGAALNRKLYLMSPGGVMLITRLEDDPVIPLNKAAVVINTVNTTRPDFSRTGASLVAHGKHLYLFGGCPCPPPRYAHVSWQRDNKLYIFGGINVTRDNQFKPLNDLWVFDLKTLKWRELDPVGVPSPRGHMGVACSGKRTVIVGGQQGREKPMDVADIYEFDEDQCCFVLPAPEQATWISARMSPCCALVTEKHLVVIDGFEDKRPLTATHIFDIRRGRDVPLSLRVACCRETKRDAALEKISAARVHLGTNGTAQQSETLQIFLTAPPGAVSFYTQHIPSLSRGLPQAGSSYLWPGKKRLPLGLQWSHSRRPLLSDSGNPDPIGIQKVSDGNGSFLTPFHVAPMHLGLPNEGTVHLAAPAPGHRPAQDYLSHLSYTLKAFSTVKGAVQYFGACQPVSSEPSWREITEVLRSCTSESERSLFWGMEATHKLAACCCFNRSDPTKEVQVYITAVINHNYYALQAPYAPGNSDVPKESKLNLEVEAITCTATLFAMLICQSELIPLLLTCACCGETEERKSQHAAGDLKAWLKAKLVIRKILSVPEHLRGLGEEFAMDVLLKLQKACIRQGLGAELAGNFAAVQLYAEPRLSPRTPRRDMDQAENFRLRAKKARPTLEAFRSSRDIVAFAAAALAVQAQHEVPVPGINADHGAANNSL